MTADPNVIADSAGWRGQQIAGLWRRVAAVSIDSIVLGAFGACLGFFLFDQIAVLGSRGRFIGGAVALAYFGVLNSRIGQGQTIGKRALKIRVVDGNATTVALPRSILRACVLLIPIALNGLYFPNAESTPLVSVVLTVCVFGLGGALVYLFFFNRHTRQSLHDLAARTFVINAQASGEIHERIWKPHLAIVLAWLLVLAIGVGPLSDLLGRTEPYQGLIGLQRAVQSVAPAAQVSVKRGTTMLATVQRGRSSTAFIRVVVATPVKPNSYEEWADRIAEAILLAHPDVRDVDQVTISISYGYDIMISSFHTTQSFSHSAQEWSDRLKVKSRTAA